MRLIFRCPLGSKVADQSGATIIEFSLTLFFGALPMVLAILQIAWINSPRSWQLRESN